MTGPGSSSGRPGGLPHVGRLALLVAATAIQTVGVLPAQPPKPTEYQMKAAYLSNFGRFVEWRPGAVGADAAEPFRVCVLGRDPFGPLLDAAVNGETINRAPITAKRILTPQDAANCRVLFISSSQDSELKSVLAALDKTAVLTVSDMPQFVKRGGMIQLVLDASRVRFAVNPAAVQRAGLKLSSQLLKLAVPFTP